MKLQRQISGQSYRANTHFIGHYQKLITDVVIPYQYRVLCDEAENVEKSHVVMNFINAGKALRGEDVGDGFYGMVFQDSDAAKWIEAAAYSLSHTPNTTLEEKIDHLIDLISEAQDEDGYLNTYFTIKDREKRWTNLLEGHELYCAGHMMEAACAYYETTGKDKLLQIMLKNMEHIYNVFITNGKEGCPGHPEVELALIRMYRLTGNAHCLELATHFINQRGQNPNFYKDEVAQRDWRVWGSDGADTDYMQASKPVREQTEAVGHAVRAVYLYTAMADLASETNDESLLAACKRLWESITKRRMYVTGGIGSTCIGEAFTVDYDLPNDTAYCETCASIGLMFFASRMLENEVNSEYADVMERAFYNTVLAGMQLDGQRFFYVNPLECIPGISGSAVTHKHDLTTRPQWYACACCPPNTARLISSFGKYAYGENEDTIFCHLFADGEVSFDNGIKLHCETAYPYDFTINYKILTGEGKMAIRIPSWSPKFTLSINSEPVSCTPQKGYIYLDISANDTIQLLLNAQPYYVYASSHIPKLTGHVALCRGPLVYCFEGIDNDDDILSLALNPNAPLKVLDFTPYELGGTTKMMVSALRTQSTKALYTTTPPSYKACLALAIPYYTWCNRGETQMRVWMNTFNTQN